MRAPGPSSHSSGPAATAHELRRDVGATDGELLGENGCDRWVEVRSGGRSSEHSSATPATHRRHAGSVNAPSMALVATAPKPKVSVAVPVASPISSSRVAAASAPRQTLRLRAWRVAEVRAGWEGCCLQRCSYEEERRMAAAVMSTAAGVLPQSLQLRVEVALRDAWGDYRSNKFLCGVALVAERRWAPRS